MRAVDFIVKHIEDHGMTQAQAAAVVGWSRQNLWDKLNNRNPRFNTMHHILTCFGYELHVVRQDGLSPDCFDEKDFFKVAKAKNIYYDDLEDLVAAMGHKLIIEKRPE